MNKTTIFLFILALTLLFGCNAPTNFDFIETKTIAYQHALPVEGGGIAYIFTDLKDDTAIQIEVEQFVNDNPKSEIVIFYDTLTAKVKKLSDKADVPNADGKYLLVDIR